MTCSFESCNLWGEPPDTILAESNDERVGACNVPVVVISGMRRLLPPLRDLAIRLVEDDDPIVFTNGLSQLEVERFENRIIIN